MALKINSQDKLKSAEERKRTLIRKAKINFALAGVSLAFAVYAYFAFMYEHVLAGNLYEEPPVVIAIIVMSFFVGRGVSRIMDLEDEIEPRFASLLFKALATFLFGTLTFFLSMIVMMGFATMTADKALNKIADEKVSILEGEGHEVLKNDDMTIISEKDGSKYEFNVKQKGDEVVITKVEMMDTEEEVVLTR